MPHTVRGFYVRFTLTIVFTSILLAAIATFSSQEAFAHGDNPSTCNNRYDGSITVAEIVADGVTYDPITNPGATFKLSNDKSYTLTFTIHTHTQSTQGNSDPGTTWYSDNAFGFGHGWCVDGAGSNQDIIVTRQLGPSFNFVSREGTQHVDFGTFGISGFSYSVMWVAPNNNATVPSQPTNLSADTVSSSQIDLSWAAPIDDGSSSIIGYQIERSMDNGSTWSVIIHNTQSTETTYSDTSLESNTTYMYRVSAINSVGVSAPSNGASATTLATLTIDSVDKLGNPLEGAWMQLQSEDGDMVAEGFTPITFDVVQGAQYTVYANSFMQHQFLHWEDGDLDSSRTITPTADIAMTAVYTITTVDKIVP